MFRWYVASEFQSVPNISSFKIWNYQFIHPYVNYVCICWILPTTITLFVKTIENWITHVNITKTQWAHMSLESFCFCFRCFKRPLRSCGLVLLDVVEMLESLPELFQRRAVPWNGPPIDDRYASPRTHFSSTHGVTEKNFLCTILRNISKSNTINVQILQNTCYIVWNKTVSVLAAFSDYYFCSVRITKISTEVDHMSIHFAQSD